MYPPLRGLYGWGVCNVSGRMPAQQTDIPNIADTTHQTDPRYPLYKLYPCRVNMAARQIKNLISFSTVRGGNKNKYSGSKLALLPTTYHFPSRLNKRYCGTRSHAAKRRHAVIAHP